MEHDMLHFRIPGRPLPVQDQHWGTIAEFELPAPIAAHIRDSASKNVNGSRAGEVQQGPTCEVHPTNGHGLSGTLADSWEDIDYSALPVPQLPTPGNERQAQDSVYGQPHPAPRDWDDEDRYHSPSPPPPRPPSPQAASPPPIPPEDSVPKFRLVRPPVEPVLLVNLTPLCGFQVSEQDAPDILAQLDEKLREDWSKRADELFEIGAAIHSTTEACTNLKRAMEHFTRAAHFVVLRYPSTIEGREVHEIWAEIERESSFKAVEVIKAYLKVTGQGLMWKLHMTQELELVARQQARAAKEAALEAEMGEWRERRRDKLRRLIEARPMFQERLAMEERKVLCAGEGGFGMDGAAKPVNPVSRAAINQLEERIQKIDELIAMLEIAEAEDGRGFIPSDDEDLDPTGDGRRWSGGEAEDPWDDGEQEAYQEAYQADGEESRGEASEGGSGEAPGPDETGRQEVREYSADGTGNGAAAGGDGLDNGEQQGAQDPAALHEAYGVRISKPRRKKKKKRPKPREAAGGAEQGGRGADADPPAVGDTGAQLPPKLNVIDAVAAMILARYPRDPEHSEVEHVESLASHHQRMKQAWLDEFETLPNLPERALM